MKKITILFIAYLLLMSLAFGNSFSPEASLHVSRKSTFTLDANGDGVKDLLFILNVDLIAKNLPAQVKVIRPWKYYGDSKSPNNFHQGGKVALFVRLKSSEGDSEYLIWDANSPSVLDTEAALDLTISKLANVAQEDLPPLKKLARGDLIVIPTEAGIDTYLYWNGNTFAVYEPSDTP